MFNIVLESKTVSGFNLSFFADEKDIINNYMEQILKWVVSGELTVPNVTVFDIKEISLAHKLIQSGSTVGKLVIKTNADLWAVMTIFMRTDGTYTNVSYEIIFSQEK